MRRFIMPIKMKLQRNLWETLRWSGYALLLALATTLIAPKPVLADEKSHLKLAEEFMVLSDTANMMVDAYDQLKNYQLEALDKLKYPGKSAAKDSELKQRVVKYLDNKLTWENFREGYIKVYADIFSEEELKELMKFYSSPVGKKVLSSINETRMKLLLSTQEQVKGMIVDIKSIERGFVSEQESKESRQEVP